MEELISQATRNNWKKLKTNKNDKLTSRANKRLSTKKIVPLEYLNNKENLNKITTLLQLIIDNNLKKESAIYSLALNLINQNKIENQNNVKKFIEEYSKIPKIDELINYDISNINEKDILGMIYQCLMMEGEKNKKGSYYTPYNVTKNMTKNLNFSKRANIFRSLLWKWSIFISIRKR